jgi:hypothetical protein
VNVDWLHEKHRWFIIVISGKVDNLGADGAGLVNEIVGVYGILLLIVSLFLVK